MIKVTHNNHYLEDEQKLKDNKMEEQIAELKRIIPEQGIKKRKIEKSLSQWISIRDRRHRSLASMGMGYNRGVEVVSFNVLKKTIRLHDRSLFDIVKEFAEKYGYKEINTEYQI